MPTFPERFTRVADWCSRNGVVAGFPNGHENTTVSPNLYGTILLTGPVDFRDVPASTLGNPADDRTRLTSAFDYALSQGYAHGYPTFHSAGAGSALVYGTWLLPASMVAWQDVPVAEILGGNIDPTTRPLRDWFTGAHDWATRNGHVAAMPNGHYAQQNGTWVVGVQRFTPGSAQWRDLTATELGYARNLRVGGGW